MNTLTNRVDGDFDLLPDRDTISDPRVVHGMIEDYRAGLAIDHLTDRADRDAGRRVECPAMVLRSIRDDLEYLYGDVLDVWRPWTTFLEGCGIDTGHHMAEDAPEELAKTIEVLLS